MYVIKRKGNKEMVSFDKVLTKIQLLTNTEPSLTNVNPVELAQAVIKGLYDGIHTHEIDTYAANVAASSSNQHLDYGTLASRIAISNHHKNTLNSFKDKMELLYLRKDVHGNVHPLVSNEFYKFVSKHHFAIDKHIDYTRDYLFDFFGFKTLEKSYLLRIDDKPIERPQDMFMRVALQLSIPSSSEDVDTYSLEKTFDVYDRLSLKFYTHATPTLFNSGSSRPQLSSCFLLSSEDSIEGIMKTLTDCVQISKWSGGIGFHCSMWRASGSLIRGTNGTSNGIIPFLKLFNDGARAFNQGGKRMGSFAAYLEPHHPDIVAFLNLRKNSGDETMRCRDLFLALFISDLFMKRVEQNGTWTTFCPNECPGLNECYGEEYTTLYESYERKGLGKETFNARDLWKMVFDSQKESGIPYMLYKDTINRNSMQKNIGIIQSSNLCSEITLVSTPTETAVCNLASICLSTFVKDMHATDEWFVDGAQVPDDKLRPLNHEFPKNPWFDYAQLAKVAGELVVNINNVVDKNWYPTIETARSNLKHRPLGIGVQGLADVFHKFRVAFESEEAKGINKKIFEAIYFGAVSKSTEMCRHAYLNALGSVSKKKSYKRTIFPKKVLSTYPLLKKENEHGTYTETYTTEEDIPKKIGTYASYETNGGSPLANGQFHWEMMGLTEKDLSGLFDWEGLRQHINMYGMYNSMLVALMPTASTSQIMGGSSCFEPYVSNIFKRKTLAGEFIIVNKYLTHELEGLGLWTPEVREYLKVSNGSIQGMVGIPTDVKQRFKTVWEIKQKSIVDMAVDRQPFVDQSQSMNLYVENFTMDKFHSMQMYAWKHQLKTGSYYIRSQPAIQPQKFTVNPLVEQEIKQTTRIPDNEETICLMCE